MNLIVVGSKCSLGFEMFSWRKKILGKIDFQIRFENVGIKSDNLTTFRLKSNCSLLAIGLAKYNTCHNMEHLVVESEILLDTTFRQFCHFCHQKVRLLRQNGQKCHRR